MKKQPQIEDAILKEVLFTALKWIVLICFVASLCVIGYLASCNHQKAITIEMYERSIDSANVINTSVHEQDSITISMMPSKEELDFFYRLKNK